MHVLQEELPLTALNNKMKKPLHCRISTYWKYLKITGQSQHLGRVNCCKVNKKITFLKAPSGKEAPLWNEKLVIQIKSSEHNLVTVYTANKTLQCVKSGRHIFFCTVPLLRKVWSIWASLSKTKHTRNNRSSESRQNNPKWGKMEDLYAQLIWGIDTLCVWGHNIAEL